METANLEKMIDISNQVRYITAGVKKSKGQTIGFTMRVCANTRSTLSVMIGRLAEFGLDPVESDKDEFDPEVTKFRGFSVEGTRYYIDYNVATRQEFQVPFKEAKNPTIEVDEDELEDLLAYELAYQLENRSIDIMCGL